MATAALRQRLLQLDAQISEQRLILANLEQKRLNVERELHATATFPVVQLPVEMTREIFLRCVGSDQIANAGYHLGNTMSQIPLNLASVCRHWREIALATPNLWSTLHFDFDYLSSEPHIIDGFIHRWLGRAESHPLSLHFRLRGIFGDDEWRDGYTPLLLHDLLDRYSKTIHFLDVDMSQNGIRQVGLDLQRFPVLKSAKVGNPWSAYGPHADHQNPVRLFGNAPSITDIHFDGSSFYYVFPWLQLTKFDGEIETMELFEMAPNLIEVRCSVELLHATPQSEIVHPRLRSLIFTESGPRSKAIDILEYLTLPALETLHVSKMRDTSYPSLVSLLDRSSPPLHTLSIRVDNPDFFDWADCITSVGTTLENLELDSPTEEVQLSLFDDRHRHTSTYRVPSVPNLRTLTFLDASPINYRALVQFLYEAPSLRSFRLFCSRSAFLDDEIAEGTSGGIHYHTLRGHLAKLAKRGMNINISTYTKTYVELVG
ncbi:hypothetical protein B0H11DRAFT_2219221 [Mycena galericulata]|nr:hypothetical protein B0H11DRAFT_2219221 [Mycena galericulata]